MILGDGLGGLMLGFGGDGDGVIGIGVGREEGAVCRGFFSGLFGRKKWKRKEDGWSALVVVRDIRQCWRSADRGISGCELYGVGIFDEWGGCGIWRVVIWIF